MNIYEIVNEQLEDKSIDSAQVKAICWGPSLGHRVRMDDGSEIPVSRNDYWLLDEYFEEMAEYWRMLQEA